LIGKELSHYKIVEAIGKSGRGVVYKSFDIKLQRPVAIKMLPSEFVAIVIK
jgi:serine/threonine protein kinase